MTGHGKEMNKRDSKAMCWKRSSKYEMTIVMFIIFISYCFSQEFPVDIR